ncbi:MAG: translation factor Sua5, partial [Flavobacteriales bacterium]|nr:translation factor Sua5 [Flavobacteriales bacterium]
ATRPTTLILDKASGVTDALIAEDGSLGVRITKDPFCRKLIHQLNRPVVSTSANFSGEKTPRHFGEIDPKLIEQVDYVVKHRQEDRKPASSSVIMKIGSGGKFKLIRK